MEFIRLYQKIIGTAAERAAMTAEEISRLGDGSEYIQVDPATGQVEGAYILYAGVWNEV